MYGNKLSWSSSIRSSRMSDRQRLTPPQTTMWPSPPCLSLSISSAVSPAAMVVLAQSAVFRVGEKAVERVVEHCRYQRPHDQNSMASGRLGTVLATGTCLFRAATPRGRGVCGLSLLLQTPLPP